jgi:hypothetical protein
MVCTRLRCKSRFASHIACTFQASLILRVQNETGKLNVSKIVSLDSPEQVEAMKQRSGGSGLEVAADERTAQSNNCEHKRQRNCKCSQSPEEHAMLGARTAGRKEPPEEHLQGLLGPEEGPFAAIARVSLADSCRGQQVHRTERCPRP